MKKLLIISAAAAVAIGVVAGDSLWFNMNNGIKNGLPVELTDSISRMSGNIVVSLQDRSVYEIPDADVENVVPGKDMEEVSISFDGDNSEILNPFAFEGVAVRKDGNKVVIESSSQDVVTYHLSGSASDGAFKIYSEHDFILHLDNLSITSSASAAINIQSKCNAGLILSGESYIVDSNKYTTDAGEDEKGCLFSEGRVKISGDGILNVVGNKKHAIAVDDVIEIDGGHVNVVSSESDGIHANDAFIMNGGSYSCRDAKGDCIDADTGHIIINDGEIDLSVSADDTKGVKCDDYLDITGGYVKLAVSGAQAKGFKTKAKMTVSGGKIEAVMTGNVVVVDNDPSYCTMIKSLDFEMTGGEISAVHSGIAGKGISADGNAVFSGGNVSIATTGDGGIYTDVNGDNDSYSSTCITIDGNLEMTGGEFVLSSSGSAGKCIKVDADAVIGTSSSGPIIDARTSGGQILVSGGTSSGGWGPGGMGNNSDYANPKVIKVVGIFTIENGIFTLNASEEGGEGLESKSDLIINGGEFCIKTADDAINAATSITINGGKIYAVASNNDAIDSNGTMTINGGKIVAVGARSPEGGIDCDNNLFKITGGTLFAIGGSNSSPTAAECTQRVLSYGATLSQNAMLTITDNSGNHILSFTNPVNYGSSAKMIISSPKFVEGGSYRIYTGGTVTPGDEFYQLVTDGTYVAGSQTTTFTSTSMVTNLGGSGGGPGGGGPGGRP